jgi:hypothetical protein
MKKLFIALLLMVGISGYAQDFKIEAPTEGQEERAEKMANTLEGLLGLTSKQEMLTRKCYSDYIVRENLVLTSDRSIVKKNTALKALYMEQRGEMFDILTKPQREKYREIRGEYDPLIQLKTDR